MLLLITACVNVAEEVPFTELRDADDRLYLLLDTLNWALNVKEFDKITICESSGYENFDFNKYVKTVNKNIQFEYITFQGNTKEIVQKGKGYGEGEIIKKFIQSSNLLKNEIFFCKITGKLLVKNIEKLYLYKRQCICFQNYLSFNGMVDTRFYMMNKKIFECYFLDAYKEVDDYAGRYLEHVYFDVLKNNSILYKCFLDFPIICGKSGTKNRFYRGTKGNLIIKFLCYFNLFNAPYLKKLGMKNLKH